jgi:hypothetical protein
MKTKASTPGWNDVKQFIEDNVKASVLVSFASVKVKGDGKNPMIVGDPRTGEPSTESYYCMKDHEQGNCDLGSEEKNVVKHAGKHLVGDTSWENDCS